jgi:hypothetical protein
VNAHGRSRQQRVYEAEHEHLEEPVHVDQERETVRLAGNEHVSRTQSGTCSRAERSANLPDNPVPLVREILATKSTRSVRDHATDPASAANTIVARLWARIRATSWSSSEAPTITPSMLDLCSASYKARRFAPPARTRGLRALTMPARRSVLAIT